MVGINTHNNKQTQAAKTFTDDSRLSHVCGALWASLCNDNQTVTKIEENHKRPTLLVFKKYFVIL